MRRSQFELLTPPPGAVVFLGDSITEFGLWNEYFPDVPVVNRGIGGETTGEVLTRVESSCKDAGAVFLLAGTNDETLGFSPDQIASNVDRILNEIARVAPDASIFVQSVMPRAAKYRPRLQALNSRYRDIAQRHDAGYLDLWPALASETGAIADGYSFDDLHLTGAGYAAWVETIRTTVEKFRA